MQKIQLLSVTPEQPAPGEQKAFRQYLQGLLLLSLRDAGIWLLLHCHICVVVV